MELNVKLTFVLKIKLEASKQGHGWRGLLEAKLAHPIPSRSSMVREGQGHRQPPDLPPTTFPHTCSMGAPGMAAPGHLARSVAPRLAAAAHR